MIGPSRPRRLRSGAAVAMREALRAAPGREPFRRCLLHDRTWYAGRCGCPAYVTGNPVVLAGWSRDRPHPHFRDNLAPAYWGRPRCCVYVVVRELRGDVDPRLEVAPDDPRLARWEAEERP